MARKKVPRSQSHSKAPATKPATSSPSIEEQLREQIAKPLDPQVLQLRVAKILGKQKAGKLLSKREQAELENFGNGPTGQASQMVPIDWVSSYEALGKLFGCHSHSFPRWKKLHADAPKPRHNGQHSTEAWRAFFAAHPEIQLAAAPAANKGDLEVERLKLQIKDLQFDYALKVGQYVLSTDAASWASEMVSEFRKVIESIPGSLAPDIVGVQTVAEAEMKIRASVDQALSMLHLGPWGSAPAPQVTEPPEAK